MPPAFFIRNRITNVIYLSLNVFWVTWDGDISSENMLPLDSSLTVLNSLKSISSLSAEALGQFSTETSPSQVKIYISSLSK